MLRPRAQRRSNEVLILALSFVLALLVEAVCVGLIVASSALIPTPERPFRASKPVVLRGLSAEQWNKNRGPARPETTVAAKDRDAKKHDDEAQKKKPPEEMPKGQVVDVAPGNNEVDPNAKFVSETNNAVKRETRAKDQTAFYRNAMPQRTAPKATDGTGHDAVDKAKENGNQGIGNDDRPLRTENPRLAVELPDVHRQQEIDLKKSDNGPGVAVSNRTETQEVKGNSSRLNLQPGTPGEGEVASAGRRGEPGALNLAPSPAVLDKISGAAANDHLQDVAEGDGTYLNTREWKYASFFNRVKQSVGQQWEPSNALRQRDPTGNIYGGRDRYTILSITLDQTGRLKDAFVEKSSGIDFLDLEAVKAFERAQPFPNPPPGLLATDSTIRFQFGFFLEMTGRPGMRLFRSAD